MNQIIRLLLILLIITSCKNAPVNFEKEALANKHKILEQAKTTILNKPEVKQLQTFEQMDSFRYKLVMEELVDITAKLLYEVDIAYLLTPDCITKPSAIIEKPIAKEKAVKDSIYHSVLVEEAKQLKDTKKLNYFSHKEFLIYHEQLKEISKELRSYCSEDVIESLEKMTKNLN